MNALAVSDQVVWEELISAGPGGWDARFESLAAAPVGTPVTLHLRTQGTNPWNLLVFERADPAHDAGVPTA